jgi:hypothetical protein
MDRALPRPLDLWPSARRILSLVTLVTLPVMWALMVIAAQSPGVDAGGDAYGYWVAWRDGLYDIPWHGAHAFVYSPPIGLALWPFSFLPWPIFFGLLTGVGMLAVVWMVGLPWAGLVLIAFYPVTHDLAVGNVHVLIAAAVASGHWWFPLLTKVTPGISLAYFLAAGQWQRAFYALGVTMVIALASFVIAPGLWAEWLTLLREGIGGTAHPWAVIDWPLTVRLPIALGLALIAGWRSWPWLLPVSVMFALPVMWVGVFALLLAIVRLARTPSRMPAQPA